MHLPADDQLAEEICAVASKGPLLRLPDVVGAAGNGAIVEILRLGPTYGWALHRRLVEVADPAALFRAVPMTIGSP